MAETQVLLDRTSREKVSVQAELEIVRTQLSTNDLDYSKVRPEWLNFNWIFLAPLCCTTCFIQWTLCCVVNTYACKTS